MAFSTYPIISIIVVIIIGVLLMVMVRRMHETDKNKKQLSGTVPAHTPTAEDAKPTMPPKALIAVVLGVVLVVGAIVFFEYRDGSDGDRDTNIASYIPIWVAVFIPIIAAKKKKGQQPVTTNQKKLLIGLVAATGLLVLVGLIVMYLR